MSSFLDKLKKGMGVEIEPSKEEITPAPRKKRPKKLEIKPEPVKAEGAKTEEIGEKKPASAEATAGKDKWFQQEGQLAIDLYETEEDLIIRSAIAGIKPEDLDISIENDRVLIKGERGEKAQEEGKNYFYQECYWGAFSREIVLPVEIDPSRAEASMNQGILTIRIPKIEREKKRKIEVKS